MVIYGYGYFLLFHPRLFLVILSYFCYLIYFILGYFRLLQVIFYCFMLFLAIVNYFTLDYL